MLKRKHFMISISYCSEDCKIVRSDCVGKRYFDLSTSQLILQVYNIYKFLICIGPDLQGLFPERRNFRKQTRLAFQYRILSSLHHRANEL